WDRLEKGMTVGSAEVDAVVRMASGQERDGAAGAALRSFNRPESGLGTRKRLITPRTVTQAAYIDALRRHDLVLGIGPAGTGKTYLAVAHGVTMLTAGQVDRIILSRPAVEA